jgi:hypothetical protein
VSGVRAARLAWVALAWLASAAERPPSAEEQRNFIQSARRAALDYAASLPDFLCTETIRREQRRRPTARMVPYDTLKVRVTYFEGKEKHELISVNDREAEESYVALTGALGEGEFGAALHTIFDPASATEFEWVSWTSLSGRRAAVFDYRVSPEKARYSMYHRSADTPLVRASVGFHGAVTVDRESYGVLRLTDEIDHVPEDFPVRSFATVIDYGPVSIAGRQHLLPQRAETVMQSRTLETRNRTRFHGYRKYVVESKVTYADKEP